VRTARKEPNHATCYRRNRWRSVVVFSGCDHCLTGAGARTRTEDLLITKLAPNLRRCEQSLTLLTVRAQA
jgi:hypothetical protein